MADIPHGYIVESTEEIELFGGWDLFRVYLGKMETQLEVLVSDFQAQVEERKKKLSPGEVQESEEDYLEDYVNLYDEFPRILRSSFFVAAYSFLEYKMVSICKWLEERNPDLDEWNPKPNLLAQFKKYCKSANFGLQFGHSDWAEIKHYSLVRDCLVHCGGLVEHFRGKERREKLTEYGSKQGILSEGRVAPTEDFCKETVGVMEKFIDSAWGAYIKERPRTTPRRPPEYRG